MLSAAGEYVTRAVMPFWQEKVCGAGVLPDGTGAVVSDEAE